MIGNDKLTTIIKDCELAGHTIKVKDISYVLLCRTFDDIAVAFKVIFGNEPNNVIMEYHKSTAMCFLRDYMDSNYAPESQPEKESKAKKRKSNNKDISFEENKTAMIELLEKTKQDEKDGLIDPEKSVTIQTKLRIALNDKFQVQNDVKEQMVIVNQKYNDICPKCSCEISRRPISKEEAIEMYGLVEKM